MSAPRFHLLRYTGGKRKTGTAKQYLEWRKLEGLPFSCDIPACHFHSGNLIWNGKALALELDHKNGNNSDDRPKNLRLLCPNCHSQQGTRGGANRGRVNKSSGGFGLYDKKTGKWHYRLPAETGVLSSKVDPRGPD